MDTDEYLAKVTEREKETAIKVKKIKGLTRKVNKQKEKLKQLKSDLQNVYYSVDKATSSQLWNNDGELRLALEA
jgi:phage-related minor tail protein